MHDDNDLAPLVNQCLDLAAQGRGIVRKTLVRRLGADRGVRNGASFVSFRMESVLNELEAFGTVPGSWSEDKDGLLVGHSVCCVLYICI